MVTNSPRYSARELCDLLELHRPTAEQEAIIEAPLEGVYRVVAGAGSGKTETMALRVVWLVANGQVAPHEILGLTFTRKAAAELGSRIARRIRQLPDRGDVDIDVFQMPQVSTYNAFASRLFQDYAVYLGVDGDQDVAGAAAAWSLARRVVSSSDHPALPTLDRSLDQVTTLTWQLSNALSENAVDTDALTSFAHDFARVRELPAGGRGSYPDVDKAAEAVELLPVLVDLVEEFRRAKKTRGLVEYSDQVRLGLEVTQAAPEVVEALRARHRVVLLDEYQDTSVLQTKLLATLFADHPVMSVGDPLQAIYGWRGASAANLHDFARDFAHEVSATTFGLQTSWRNPTRILEAANALCEPLRGPDRNEVGQLTAPDDADTGELDVIYTDTLDQEADALAKWFATRLDGVDSDQAPSAALLLRERKHQHVFARALERAGIPVHILGIGGLLSDALVADLIAGLAVVHRPHANGELVRILTSGRFRLGVADLFALAERARWLGLRDRFGGGLDDSLDEALREQALGRPRASLLEALEYLARKDDDHGHWAEFSDAGRVALREVDAFITAQRRVAHETISDQVSHWERLLGLDIEWMAHPAHERYREAREAFFDAIAQYQALADEAGPAGFLDWLEQAEWRDSLQPQSAPPEPGCVQILTIHGAKGLEWDLVAVGQMTDGGLPGTPNEGYRGWLRAGTLPYAFRGDREFLPELVWTCCETRKELVDRIAQFREDIRVHHNREERRLAYVAMTRAKKQLLLTGSFFAHTTQAADPSEFLRELDDRNLIDALPPLPGIESAPEPGDEDVMVWPADPLGSRRGAIEAAAASLREALESNQPVSESVAAHIDAVIADEQLRTTPAPVEWPIRLPASQFDRWVFEPEAMLAQRAQPRPPTMGLAQQRGKPISLLGGVLFSRLHRGRVLGDVDVDGGDDQWTDQDVASWQSAFEASEFASLTPLALEREIHLPLAGHLVICKIDAVFDTDGRVVIVDWKTGRMPSGDDEVARKSLQLALYRLAWSEWAGTPLDSVDAVFWFSAANQTIHPPSLPGRVELEQMVIQAKQRSGSAQPGGEFGA